jgi:hypothetical protein
MNEEVPGSQADESCDMIVGTDLFSGRENWNQDKTKPGQPGGWSPFLRSPRKSKISVEANLLDRLPKLKALLCEGNRSSRLCRN